MSIRITVQPGQFAFSARLRVPIQAIEAFGAILGTFLLSRLLILGVVSTFFSASELSTGTALAFDGWNGWDSLGYLALARDGYWFDPLTGQGTPALLPLYPLLVRALGAIVPNLADAALLVSNLAFVLGLLAVYRLVLVRSGRHDLALLAALLLEVFPFSLALSAATPGSLVLLAGSVALLAEEVGWSWLAIAAAIVALLSDPLGVIVGLSIIVGRLARWTRVRTAARAELGSLAAGLAFVVGFLIWFRAHLAGLGYPPITLEDLVGGATVSPSTLAASLASAAHSQPGLFVAALGFTVLGLATLPRVFRQFHVVGAVYATLLIGLAVARLPTDGGRLLALAFPSFAVIAERLERRGAALAALGLSALLFSGVAVALAAAASSPPSPIVPPARTFDDTLRATYHLAVALARPRSAAPRDLFLTVDDTFVLLGDAPPARRFQPGATVPISSYLYVLRTPEHGYLLSARLLDARGQDVAQASKVIGDPADGSLTNPGAPAALFADNYLQDNLALPLSSRLPLGLYSVETEVFSIPSFARLPLQSSTGAQLDQVSYGSIVVAQSGAFGDSASVRPAQPLRADSDAAISLLGSDLRADPAGLQVSLIWEAQAQPQYDYTVFVQGLDQSGRVIAQSDSYPAAGLFPTSGLRPGEVIRDTRVLNVPANARDRPLRLIVGLYRLETMRRVTFGAGPPRDHVDLGTIIPANLPSP